MATRGDVKLKGKTLNKKKLENLDIFIPPLDEQKEIVRDLVEIIYFEDEYAYVNGTINNGDLVILGGASKIIAGKKINL